MNKGYNKNTPIETKMKKDSPSLSPPLPPSPPPRPPFHLTTRTGAGEWWQQY